MRRLSSRSRFVPCECSRLPKSCLVPSAQGYLFFFVKPKLLLQKTSDCSKITSTPNHHVTAWHVYIHTVMRQKPLNYRRKQMVVMNGFVQELNLLKRKYTRANNPHQHNKQQEASHKTAFIFSASIHVVQSRRPLVRIFFIRNSGSLSREK